MEAFFKWIVWTIVSTGVELVSAFIIAGMAVLFFNLAGIPALAAVGYWSLYWIQMAIYFSIESAVIIAIASHEFFAD